MEAMVEKGIKAFISPGYQRIKILVRWDKKQPRSPGATTLHKANSTSHFSQ